MTKFNIKLQKEDVLSKTFFKESKRKFKDKEYWEKQKKIQKEIFK